MMPLVQLYRFKYSLKNSDVRLMRVPRAGHFAGTDQPNFISASILNFIEEVSGKEALADIFLGFDGIWKGDERQMIKDLRTIYGM